MCVGYFNSRLYTRGDVTANLVKKEIPLFQFTPLHERRRNQSVWISNDDYFNSRLYTRGDKLLSRHWCICQISIHASTREATATETANAKSQFISIHASTREATISTTTLSLKFLFQFTPLHERRLQPVWQWLCHIYFNSRLYTRGDVEILPKDSKRRISIHASTREATCGCSTDFFPASYFNSRLYMRGNVLRSTRTESENQFQFTPLHERQLEVDQW